MRKRKGAAINPRPKPTDAWTQDPMATKAKTARAAAGSSGKDSGNLQSIYVERRPQFKHVFEVLARLPGWH
jgi:hypothetical protein